MKVNLRSMNAAQLDALIDRANARKEELQQEQVLRVREKIEDMLKEAGVTLRDVLGGKRSRGLKPLTGQLDPWLRLRVATGQVAKPDARKQRAGMKLRGRASPR